MSKTSAEFLFCAQHQDGDKENEAQIQDLSELMTSPFRIQPPGPPGEKFNSFLPLLALFQKKSTSKFHGPRN